MLPEPLFSGKRRKIYWIFSRGSLVFIAVLSFYIISPIIVEYLNIGQISSNNRLLATSIFASSLLIFVLVAVYRDLGETQAQQAKIMDEQRDLRRMELNREVREKHTEVLRHRIEEWLGQEPATNVDFGAQIDQEHTLPTVTRTSVESAARGTWAIGREQPFSAAPAWLVDERYFQDLLENHAPELNELKEEIESLHSDYSKLRSKFTNSLEEGPKTETPEYIIRPASSYPDWIFTLVVLTERGFESKDDLTDLADNIIAGSSMGKDRSLYFPGEEGYAAPIGVFEVEAKTKDLDFLSSKKDVIEEELITMAREAIEEIDEAPRYDVAKEAAQKIDELDETISKLRFKLNEFQGLPLYPGECEYLEEELIK